jgi:hypothetical protein
MHAFNHQSEEDKIQRMKLFMLLYLLFCSVVAFVPSGSQMTHSRSRAMLSALDASSQVHDDLLGQSVSGMAAVASSFALLPVGVARATEELEIAELPPVYVPVLFGVGLLVGVGFLTSSLGNVMDEESSLGMQSGARAKKEAERSRSSYFKK